MIIRKTRIQEPKALE